MNEAYVSFTGNLTDDVSLKFTPSGVAVANVTVAVTGREKKNDAWVDGSTAFYRVTLWRDAAENLANSVTKGDRVSVVGRLKLRDFMEQGVKRTSLDVDADSVALDVRFTTAHFAERAQRSKPTQPVEDPWTTPAPAFDAPPF